MFIRTIRRSFIALLGAACAGLIAGCSPARATISPGIARRLAHEPVISIASQDEVNLLAIADWGQNTDEQRNVAAAMRDRVARSPGEYAAVVTGGDNMYVGLSGTDDPSWDAVFEDVYDSDVLNMPFYVTLGNHDYDGGKLKIEQAYSQTHPESRWKFPLRYYRLDFPHGSPSPLVSVLMLDSNYDRMGDDAWNAEVEWLDHELAKPRTSRWLIAVGHHPFFSNGDHGDNGVLQRTWGPRFRKAGVDLYVCGHDHDLQHLEIPGWPMSFLLVGGGGADTRRMRNDRRGPFSRRLNGFGEILATPEKLTVNLIDMHGNVVHAFERSHDGRVQVIQGAARDVAIPRSVKSITRPDLDDATTQPATSQGGK